MTRAAYVVLDLETTGLDPKKDQILEVGAIAVTTELDEIDRFHRICRCPIEAIDKAADVVREMHSRNGLWSACVAPFRASEAEVGLDLSSWLADVGGPQVILMGNSIHFDHAFLKERMPHAATHLHYRLMDIGGLARWLRDFGCELEPPPDMPHRGLEDCEIELDSARYIRRMVMP